MTLAQRSLVFGFVILAAAVLGAGPRPAAAESPGMAKVVYHVDFNSPRRFSALLTNVHNMVTTYENDLRSYDVRLVFNAHGIRFVTDDPLKGTPFEEGEALAERRDNLKGRLASLRDVYGVKLEVCGITREEIGLAKDKLYEGVKLVTSGVARVADLQQDGFAYIKVE